MNKRLRDDITVRYAGAGTVMYGTTVLAIYVTAWILIPILLTATAVGSVVVVKKVTIKQRRESAIAAMAAEAEAKKLLYEAAMRRKQLDRWYDTERAKGLIAGSPPWFDKQVALAVESAANDKGFVSRCQRLGLDHKELLVWANEQLHVPAPHDERAIVAAQQAVIDYFDKLKEKRNYK